MTTANNNKQQQTMIAINQTVACSMSNWQDRIYVNLTSADKSYAGDRNYKVYIDADGVINYQMGKGTCTSDFLADIDRLKNIVAPSLDTDNNDAKNVMISYFNLCVAKVQSLAADSNMIQGMLDNAHKADSSLASDVYSKHLTNKAANEDYLSIARVCR